VRRSYSVIGLSVLALLSFASFAFSQQGSLSKSSLTFAPQLAGSVSTPQTVNLTNSGTAALLVTSVAASGGYSASSNCSTLNPGAICTISVRFISGFVGVYDGTTQLLIMLP
jgi:hypothetical protein